MKVVDIIFSLICGRVVGFLVSDFLKEWEVSIGIYEHVIVWVFLPFISLVCLWVAYTIGKKLAFVFQVAKFLLVGAFATVIDLKIFEFSVWLFSFMLLSSAIIAKIISFLVATSLKYWGNKYWAFVGHVPKDVIPFELINSEQKNWKREFVHFFAVTTLGLIIDVGAFYYFTKIMNPQFGFSVMLWTKLGVIFAALAAAAFNFLGYKFLVFKK